MKKLKDLELKLCDVQGKIFENSIETTECSSPVFVRRFMNSGVASRIDRGSYFMESSGVDRIYEEIEIEYGKSKYGKKKYNQNELYWMGYIYRYWNIALELSSKNIYKVINAEKLRKLFFAYHTLSIEQAIERIYEEKGLKPLDFEERQRKLMRERISLYLEK